VFWTFICLFFIRYSGFVSMFLATKHTRKSVDYLNFSCSDVPIFFEEQHYKFENESIQKCSLILFLIIKVCMILLHDLVFVVFIVNLLVKGVRKRYSNVHNLRHGGSVLIDRKIPNKPFQLLKLAEYIEKTIVRLLFSRRNRSKTGVRKNSLKQD
jgi:hypothetical protein